ncbi:hypothetical protein [Streptomyces sp. SCSIO 30461]
MLAESHFQLGDWRQAEATLKRLACSAPRGEPRPRHVPGC